MKDIEALKEVWPKLDKGLQESFSIAYNENRFVGDGGIKTKDLFAALLRNNSLELKPIVENIPKSALPEATSGEILTAPYVIEESPWLSHCISSSIARLSKNLSANETISPIDIFVDIAKNGTGESVRLLRKNNIGPAEIDALVKRANLFVKA